MTRDSVEALKSSDEVWVATHSGSAPEVVHLDGPEECYQLSAATGVRRVSHPAGLPLSCDDVCSQCDEAGRWTDDDDTGQATWPVPGGGDD